MITDSGGSVADLGEWGLIAALAARMPPGPFTELGIGDDSAVVAAPSGSVVVAVDLLLEGRHFLTSWSSAYDVGVKAAARSLADIAAMGAVPTALLVAFAAPGSLPAQWAIDLAAGLAAEASRAGAGVVGGDTASADSVLVSVTALGDLSGRPPVRRAGARPGDVVAVAGPLGHSAAGHALLAAGIDAFPDLVAAHLRPAPPYDAGPEAAMLGATAMIDVSDGLISDLGHLADASGVWIDVNSAALTPGDTLAVAAASVAAAPSRPSDPSDPSEPPSASQPPGPSELPSPSQSRGPSEPASPSQSPGPSQPPGPPHPSTEGAASSADTLALRWSLTGGEDHSLVAAFPPSAALPARWRVIGVVQPATTPRVTVDGAPYTGPGGWEHFR